MLEIFHCTHYYHKVYSLLVMVHIGLTCRSTVFEVSFRCASLMMVTIEQQQLAAKECLNVCQHSHQFVLKV